MPDWRDDAAAAIDAWIAAEGRGDREPGGGGWSSLESLRDSLRSLTDAGGLAERLVLARPDPLPGGSSEEPPAGFMPGQARAFQACVTPGLRLVWGPSGAARTLVLAAAIARLLERGRRVLLVSRSDAAVDGALREVRRIRHWRPGTLVRAGAPEAAGDVSETDVDDLIHAHESAERARIEAERAWTEIEPARSHLERAAALRADVEESRMAADRARRREAEMVDRHHSMREHLAKEESATGLAWLRNRTEASRLREQMARLGARVEVLRKEADAAEERADDRRRLLASRIAEHERQAAPLDPEQVEARRVELEAARQRAAETARAVEAASRQVEAWQTEREVIDSALLVATTLTGFWLHPAVSTGAYDAVLLDEVGATTLAEALVPVAAARQTAVLLGDLPRPAPPPNEAEHSEDPGVRRWIHGTCFAHCGIRTPEEARAHEACAVLEEL